MCKNSCKLDYFACAWEEVREETTKNHGSAETIFFWLEDQE